eukprot:1161981-Pelagomonas_calceolata.AAC.3
MPQTFSYPSPHGRVNPAVSEPHSRMAFVDDAGPMCALEPESRQQMCDNLLVKHAGDSSRTALDHNAHSQQQQQRQRTDTITCLTRALITNTSNYMPDMGNNNMFKGCNTAVGNAVDSFFGAGVLHLTTLSQAMQMLIARQSRC